MPENLSLVGNASPYTFLDYTDSHSYNIKCNKKYLFSGFKDISVLLATLNPGIDASGNDLGYRGALEILLDIGKVAPDAARPHRRRAAVNVNGVFLGALSKLVNALAAGEEVLSRDVDGTADVWGGRKVVAANVQDHVAVVTSIVDPL